MRREKPEQLVKLSCPECQWQTPEGKPISATLFECPKCGEWLDEHRDVTRTASVSGTISPEYFRQLAAVVPNVGFARDLKAFANYLERNSEILGKVPIQ